MTASGTSEDRRVRVFISYSHRGKGLEWKNELLSQLAVFEKHGVLDVWHDDEMKLGENWHERINTAMKGAKLAVLLLTDEFLKSPFVLQHELPILQRLHQEGGLIIAPILCEECGWPANAWLASLQIKPREQATPIPLTSLSNREQVLRQLATEIAVELGAAALNELPRSSQTPPATRIYLDKFPLTHGPGLREEKLIGREQELALLDLAFAQPHTSIVTLVAWGGVGKTMLVQHWLRHLQRENWFGIQRVYAWSFYSQGTKEDRQASEDTFLAHALEWFGVQCEPTLSPWDKGRLLADAVARERILLILDGIEPLQYPPGPMGGQLRKLGEDESHLRAPGVLSLLKHLARNTNARDSKFNGSLCLVTTRVWLADLSDFQRREGSPWGSVLRVDLGNLTDEAGAALLHHAGASRAGAAEIKPEDKELLAASREVAGHALTLNLLGRFLTLAHRGDILRRNIIKFEREDEAYKHVFKVLAAYERWFKSGGEPGKRKLALLQILGVFDRPAYPNCVASLRRPPVINGLTAPLFNARIRVLNWRAGLSPMGDEDFNQIVSELEIAGLVVLVPSEYVDIKGFGEKVAKQRMRAASRYINFPIGEPSTFPKHEPENPNSLQAIDTHPLLREHFATQLQMADQRSWIRGNRRLFDYLRTSVPFWPDGLIGLEPLYQALTHGCRAHLYQHVCDRVYGDRIMRGDDSYASREIGASGRNLEAIGCFFEQHWGKPYHSIRMSTQGWLLNEAAFHLRALGRLSEAVEPARASLSVAFQTKDKLNMVIYSNNLSELELAIGDIAKGMRHSSQSAALSLDANDTFLIVGTVTTWADALHQAGRNEEAKERFLAAEKSQAIRQPEYPLLHSVQGFRYCNFLLAPAERMAWQVSCLDGKANRPKPPQLVRLSVECEEIIRRANQILQWTEKQPIGPLHTSLEYLTVGRAVLYQIILSDSTIPISHPRLQVASNHLDAAVNGLRVANQQWITPHGFLSRAWLHFLGGDVKAARADLDEAWDIAERGPMRLHMADIHLYRARLFFRGKEYPWRVGKNLNGEFVTNRTAADDLAAAEKLINDCGYHRRDEELADAKRAILGAA